MIKGARKGTLTVWVTQIVSIILKQMGLEFRTEGTPHQKIKTQRSIMRPASHSLFLRVILLCLFIYIRMPPRLNFLDVMSNV